MVYLIGITATQAGCSDAQIARARRGIVVRRDYIESNYTRTACFPAFRVAAVAW